MRIDTAACSARRTRGSCQPCGRVFGSGSSASMGVVSESVRAMHHEFRRRAPVWQRVPLGETLCESGGGPRRTGGEPHACPEASQLPRCRCPRCAVAGERVRRGTGARRRGPHAGRRPDHGGLVRLPRERAAGPDLRPGAGSRRLRRRPGLGRRAPRAGRAGPGAGPGGVRARVRRHGHAVPLTRRPPPDQRRGRHVRGPSAPAAGPAAGGAGAVPGPGRQRGGGHRRRGRALRARHGQRPAGGGAEPHLRRTARLPGAAVLPRRAALDLRARLRPLHGPRRGRAPHPPGARRRAHRRRPAVHHRPPHRGRGPGDADRRPRAAAGGERHAAGADRGGGALGRRLRGHRRRGVGRPHLRRPPGHERAAGSGRAGRRRGRPLARRSGAGVTAPGELGDLTPDVAATALESSEARGRLRAGRRRRRPTGAAPPLPRSLGRTGKRWAVALVVAVLAIGLLLVSADARRLVDQADAAVLRALASVRTPWLTSLARGIDRVATGWWMTFIALGVVVAQVVFRRWRHLFTFLASILVMELVVVVLYQAFSRPRPYDVTTIGRWAGFSSPSPPAVVVAAVLVAILYSLVPAGESRNKAKWVAGGVLAVVVLARLYLAVDHPFDAAVGLIIGIAFPLAAFRLFTPNQYVPVEYRRGKTAHLDVGGARGEAIIGAVRDQLGLTVLEAKPVGLEGSGGSTPLRLRVATTTEDGATADTYLFAKLFAMNHVRADRWYKLGRRLLYGRLEDEARFSNVRRLVEYEDYALRLLRDAGIPTAAPYGIVEITPEREYMLVTSFIE